MAGIASGIGRAINYRMGGVTQILIFPTFQNDGTYTASYAMTGGVITGITFADDTNPFWIDAEENTAFYSANTQISANRYVKHKLGFSVGGHSDELAAVIKALDLYRHTAFVKTKSGRLIVLGRVNGMAAVKSEAGAGASEDDAFAHVMELETGETEQPLCLTESLWLAQVAAADSAKAIG